MLITLLTDFGDQDGLAGVMKGVIATRAPSAQVIDLAHHVPPGDIRHAAHVLASSAPFFPAGSCHVVVVDPGVGTDRLAVALAVDDQIYVAPDNGVLTDVLAAAAGRVGGVALTNPAFWQHPVSATFHGRDVFAPVAAYLATGVPLSALGTAIDPSTLQRLPTPKPTASGQAVAGEVVYVDGFGNAITNIARIHLASLAADGTGLQVVFGERTCPLATSYGSVANGEPVAYIGSCGRVEVAINGDRAADRFDLRVGHVVTVSPR